MTLEKVCTEKLSSSLQESHLSCINTLSLSFLLSSSFSLSSIYVFHSAQLGQIKCGLIYEFLLPSSKYIHRIWITVAAVSLYCCCCKYMCVPFISVHHPKKKIHQSRPFISECIIKEGKMWERQKKSEFFTTLFEIYLDRKANGFFTLLPRVALNLCERCHRTAGLREKFFLNNLASNFGIEWRKWKLLN